MKNNAQNALTNPVFRVLSTTAKELGMKAYVVGGFVRDYLMERDNDDIDVVVEGSGLDFAKAFAEKVNSAVDLYENFGTAKVHIGPESPLYKSLTNPEIEFVGCRKEMYERGSRKPIVDDGTLEEDLSRRDFTINAMAISLNEENYGELIDLFDGLKDISNGIIRCVGVPDDRFKEDPLRIYRAVRFKCKLSSPGHEFNYDIPTFEAMEKNAYRNEILSKERIVEELNKIMATPYASSGIRVLSEIGLLKLILPEVEAMKCPNDKGHKDIFEHTLQVLDNVVMRSNDLYLRYAALLHDIGKVPTRKKEAHGWTFHGHPEAGEKMVDKIFRRMKMPNDTRMEFVKKMVRLHMRPTTLAEEGVTDSAIRRILFDAGEDFDSLMILCESDVTSRYEARRQRVYDNIQIIKTRAKEIEEKDALRNFKNPIDGNYIMDVYQISPCKEIAVIKDYVKEAILDGRIGNNFEEAVSVMIEIGEKIGLKLKKDTYGRKTED